MSCGTPRPYKQPFNIQKESNRAAAEIVGGNGFPKSTHPRYIAGSDHGSFPWRKTKAVFFFLSQFQIPESFRLIVEADRPKGTGQGQIR